MGGSVGPLVGGEVGFLVGDGEGCLVGYFVGDMVGPFVGIRVGYGVATAGTGGGVLTPSFPSLVTVGLDVFDRVFPSCTGAEVGGDVEIGGCGAGVDPTVGIGVMVGSTMGIATGVAVMLGSDAPSPPTTNALLLVLLPPSSFRK